MMSVLLNVGWSLLALFAAILSVPRAVRIHRRPFAILVTVRGFWWKRAKGVRAATSGFVILLGPRLEPNDVEHELIHVEQHYREPFVHPFLYIFQSMKYGYRSNKYEVEAYDKSKNSLKGKL